MSSTDMNLNYVLKDKSIDYELPEVSKCLTENVWKIDFLDQIKCDLNECKNLLNEKPLNEWSTHTALTDKSSLIKNKIEKQLTTKPLLLTRAWIKFFEILSYFPIIENQLHHKTNVDSNNTSLKCLFLCESPGSFINAFNHYIISHFDHQLRFEWMANTLNPYYEDIDYTIIEDKFIKQINCYRNWFFGSTNTGNILEQNFLADLQKEMGSEPKMDFVSCDGSINCVDCPQSQEEMITQLLFKEIIISLNVIQENASLVVKCFTLFECQTVCLLYMLCCGFDIINIFKPTASKSGNSEVYLICMGFRPTDKLNSIISLLNNYNMTNDSKAIFSRESIPLQFLSKLKECVELFSDRQKLTIKTNLNLFNNINHHKRQSIINYNKFIAKTFVKKYNLFSISVCDQLSPDIDFETDNCLRFKKLNNLLTNQNCYNIRKQNQFFSKIWFKKLSQLLTEISESLDIKNQLIAFKYWKQSSDLRAFQINLVFGSPYHRIQCSKFCDLSLIITYNHCINYLIKFGEMGKDFKGFGSQTRDILKNLISVSERKSHFNQIIGLDKTNKSLVEEISGLTVNNDIKHLYYSDNSFHNDFQPNNRNIFTINAFLKLSLDLNHEKIVLNELLLNFITLNPFINENDILVVHIFNSLTRLMSGTLYLISKLFKSYAFVPYICSKFNQRNGIICIFSIKSNDEKMVSRIVCDLKLISSHLNGKSDPKLETDLLEIISVPLLMREIKFYESLFNANTIQIMETIKYITNKLEND